MKIIKKIQICALMTMLLGGCGSSSIPEFGDMSMRYADVLEQYQINMIFQNIIRAADYRPLSFLDIPNINGSGSIALAPSASAAFNGGLYRPMRLDPILWEAWLQ